MNAQAPNPAQWFADLLVAQQAMLQQIGATGTGTEAPAGSGKLLPWLPMTVAFVDWQQQPMKQFTAGWMAALPVWCALPVAGAGDRPSAADRGTMIEGVSA